ncbi:MAG: NosD domain-containing protein, partial [Patescibacteria group bacterium]
MNDYLEVAEGVTLTIESGVVVKFNQSYVDVYGKIIALGTAQDKIYFTSFLDDSVGGDTNGDGAATLPDSGDWFGISFYSPSTRSKFEYADFKYASTNFYLDASDLSLASSTVSFADDAAIISNESDLSVADSAFDGNYYGIDTTKGRLVLRGNSFTNNYMPVYADYETVLENSGNSMSGNEHNGIVLYGDLYYVESDKTFYKDVPYVLFDDLFVNKNSTLTIEPGVVIKPFYYGAEIDVYGKLNAVGTEEDPIVVTSLSDDAYGGDTNGDGDASLPDPWGWGDWDGLYFGTLSSNSILKNMTLRYYRNMYFDSVDISIDNINLENNRNPVFIYKGKVKIENSTVKDNTNAI